MSNWRVGQRVVCVSYGVGGLHPLTVGAIYTIEGVCACNCRTRLFVGNRYTGNAITSCVSNCGWEANQYDRRVWYGAQLFRPLDELDATLDRIESEAVKLTEPQPEFA